MPQYIDPEQIYRLDYPEAWLPLTHEGSPHITFASLTTGGYLRLEAYRFASQPAEKLRPEHALQMLLQCELQTHPDAAHTPVRSFQRDGMSIATCELTRAERKPTQTTADFGYLRAWVFSRHTAQVRALYRCRTADIGMDDNELNAIVDSLTIQEATLLNAAGFGCYYFSLLKRHRPQLALHPPEGLALRLAGGQLVLLEQLYGQYRQQPDRRDELIERHISLLDCCGDDVPDLDDLKRVKTRLYPRVCRRYSSHLPPHRVPYWPGLAIGAVIRGDVFTYGVNTERLRTWGCRSLDDIMDILLENIYQQPPLPPRGLRQPDGLTCAVSYLDRPLCASFILFHDFYQTTAYNLRAKTFLVGLPDVNCLSCFRDDDPRFVVQHTAMLRWDYHHSTDRLTDTIYLVSGPTLADVHPYDVLHCRIRCA